MFSSSSENSIRLTGRVQPTPAEIQKSMFLSTTMPIHVPMPLADALTALATARGVYPEDLSPNFYGTLEHYRSHDIFVTMNVEAPVMFVTSSDDILTPMTGSRAIETGFTINSSNAASVAVVDWTVTR